MGGDNAIRRDANDIEITFVPWHPHEPGIVACGDISYRPGQPHVTLGSSAVPGILLGG